MRENTFEQWLGTFVPRARMYVGDPGPVQRMTISFVDGEGLYCGVAAHIAYRASNLATWVLERTDWRLRADGRLEVRMMEFVRGMP